MDFRTELLTQVLVCLLVLAVVAMALWRSKIRSVGLPLAYLLSLAMIHWMGGLIHTLPWFEGNYSSAVVAFGFRECFAGVLAFAAGTLIAAPQVLKRARWFQRFDQPIASPPSLSLLYLVVGVLFVGVLIPVVKTIPSVGAVAVCGAYLIVAGLCLACWQSWVAKNRFGVLLKLCLSAGFPAFTVLTMGFIGYGTLAALVVLIFVSSFYRPRWQVALGLAAVFYFGLSLFVTYMRDRDELREMIRGEEAYVERVNALSEMIQNFEWIDLNNERHLELIDIRLNQNFLVGAAKVNLLLGDVPFARGGTLWEAVLAVVPRILWPNKPVRAGSPEIVEQITGIPFNEETSVGVGQVMEFYVNFGRVGVLLGFFCMGTLLRIVDAAAARHLYRGDWAGFVTWFLPGLGFLQAGGSLIEVSGTVATCTLLVIVLNKVFLPYLVSKPALRSSLQRKSSERSTVRSD
jgi:hypothetical protein